MKKMAEIMEDLGFRPDASDDVKKAFIKNLIKQAHASEFQRMNPDVKRKAPEPTEASTRPGEQMDLFNQKLSS